MVSTKPKGYFVIRVGKIQNLAINPVDEINKVIKKNGFSYFAKIGKQLAEARVNKFIEKYEPYFVISYSENKNYKSKTYKLIEISNKINPNPSLYPSYYKDIGLVSNWFKIEDTPEQADLSSLMIQSSFRSIIDALHSTSGGHFFCISK